MKHLQDLHVLILGLGASGLAMARWCARHGARVTVADTREAPPQLAALRRELPGAAFVGGPLSAALIDTTPVRAVYRSPGLAPSTLAPVLDSARATGLPVGGELDLFALALRDLATVEPPEPGDETARFEALAAAPAEVAHDVADVAPDADPSEAVETAEIVRTADSAGTTGVEVPSDPAVAAPTSVHTAARDAAAFVARIVGRSTATRPAVVAQNDSPAPPALVRPPEPARSRGYTPAVLAVTGTNGKTTVTALTGQLVARAGKTVAVAGNIGPTLLDTLAGHLDAGTLPQVWVLELSSFQLDGASHFEPSAATVLNLTQDHLDWHGDMAAYAAAKARVFGGTGLMVLNRDDAGVMAMLSVPAPVPASVRAKLQRPQIRSHVTFGADSPRRSGDYGIERVNGMAWLVRAQDADDTPRRKRGADAEGERPVLLQRLMPADALRIRGQHNALNGLAALALGEAAGCALSAMLYGLREYGGEPHRVEPVAVIEEVEYFDDSKGTNVGATAAALRGLGAERRLVVILGGDGKGQDFSPLADPVRRHARAVVLIGRDASSIAAALQDADVPLLAAETLHEAVRTAAGRACAGDAVLLSPACASFDMFRGYEHRAEVFRDAVQALA